MKMYVSICLSVAVYICDYDTVCVTVSCMSVPVAISVCVSVILSVCVSVPVSVSMCVCL